MEDLTKLEAVFRRIAREEIARALRAAGEVSVNAMGDTGGNGDIARGVVAGVVNRVARDVLADTHPALDPVHTSTEPVHTITAVPERARASCTCHRHTHVMGHDDRCGAPFCYCLTPLRARTAVAGTHAGHTILGGRCVTCSEAEHTSTDGLDYNRECSVCKHGEHDQGECGMHVYRRGVPVPCGCLASRTLGAQTRSGARVACSICDHAPHGDGDCGAVVAQGTPFAAPCECGGRA